MLVSEVMSSEVETCDREDTLVDAVNRMLDVDVGSVVVTRDGAPTGIVTKTDALRAGRRFDRPFSEIPIADACTDRLHTIKPGASVRRAADLMAEHDVAKLPVVDGLELVGMITLTDIVWNFPSIRSEARRLAEQHRRWEPP